jgi:acyl carrier protein phosphodiesterase
MNYLAHILLSGNDRRCQVGNFIGDFVKGNRYEDYPAKIRRGILLHRKIDSFTDSHPLVLDTVALLRPVFGRYSAIIVDVCFDHFLASGFGRYAPGRSLRCTAFNFYYACIRYHGSLPPRVKRFIWHFIGTNRLMRYGTIDGLHEAFTIMAGYKIPALQPDEIMAFLEQNRQRMEDNFARFFPQLMEYAAKERQLME